MKTPQQQAEDIAWQFKAGNSIFQRETGIHQIVDLITERDEAIAEIAKARHGASGLCCSLRENLLKENEVLKKQNEELVNAVEEVLKNGLLFHAQQSLRSAITAARSGK